MASIFSPLPSTTTAAICSLSSLLVTSFKQHLAPQSLLYSSSQTSAPLPSPLTSTLNIWFLCRNSTCGQDIITTTSAPHQRCQHLLNAALPTRQQDNKLTTLLAILLISIHDAILTTCALLPSHLSVDSHHAYFKPSHTHQIILKTLMIFIADMEF